MIAALLAALLLAACGGSSADGPEPVTASELEQILAGNTIIGEWLGEPYRQYFDPDGSTLYAPVGARVSSGQWRVNTDAETYESWWNERDGWESYDVLRLDDTFYWTGGGVEQSPFTVVEGKRLGAAG